MENSDTHSALDIYYRYVDKKFNEDLYADIYEYMLGFDYSDCLKGIVGISNMMYVVNSKIFQPVTIEAVRVLYGDEKFIYSEVLEYMESSDTKGNTLAEKYVNFYIKYLRDLRTFAKEYSIKYSESVNLLLHLNSQMNDKDLRIPPKIFVKSKNFYKMLEFCMTIDE